MQGPAGRQAGRQAGVSSHVRRLRMLSPKEKGRQTLNKAPDSEEGKG